MNLFCYSDALKYVTHNCTYAFMLLLLICSMSFYYKMYEMSDYQPVVQGVSIQISIILNSFLSKLDFN